MSNLSKRLARLEEIPVPTRDEAYAVIQRLPLHALRAVGEDVDVEGDAESDLAAANKYESSLSQHQKRHFRDHRVRHVVRAFMGRGYTFSDVDDEPLG